MTPYSTNDHIHNFACWTAAAAVRRGFTTNKNIADAIEWSSLRDQANELLLGRINYESIHDECCKKLEEYLKTQVLFEDRDKKELFDRKCTYGRMAKIVAIYMKTYLIVPNLKRPESANVMETIYPPIDQILLNGIKEKNESFYSISKSYKWTKAFEAEYYRLKKTIEDEGLPFNWRLEVFWKGYRLEQE